MHKRVFDYGSHSRDGIAAILYGKGVLVTSTVVWLMMIFVTGFFALPWITDPRIVIARGLLVLSVAGVIRGYSRLIISVSCGEENLYVRTCKKEIVYSLTDLNIIKFAYYRSWGIASVKVKGKGTGKTFYLWAPSFERERYNLYLEMKETLEGVLSQRGDGTAA